MSGATRVKNQGSLLSEKERDSSLQKSNQKISTLSSNSILPPPKSDPVPSPRLWPWPSQPSYALSTWCSRPTNLSYIDACSNTGREAGSEAQRIEMEVKCCSSVTQVSTLEKSGKCQCRDCADTTKISIPFGRPFQALKKISSTITSTSTSASFSTPARNNNNNHNYHLRETDLRTFRAHCDDYKRNIGAISDTGVGTGSVKFLYPAAQEKVAAAAGPYAFNADAENDRMRTTHHPAPEITLFKCQLCLEVFLKMHTLRRHWGTHITAMIIEDKATHVCPVCAKGFMSKNYARCHLRLHFGDSPYKCDACGAKFITQANLTSHLNTHINIGLQFICSSCGANNKRACHFEQHAKSCRGN